MRKFNVTVNGNTYEVEIEEITDGAGSSAQAAPTPAKTASMPAPAAKAPAKAPSVAGGTPIESPLSATVLKINCKVGQAVKKGEVVCVLEAMKMENDISSPADGTIAEVKVSIGDSVAAQDTLFVLK